MRRRKAILPAGLALLAVLAASVAAARPLTETEVRDAVRTWVRGITAEARPDAAIERLIPRETDGRVTSYAVLLDGGGFCLAGADDLVLPVYLYSPRGTYRPDDPNLRIIEEEIAARTGAYARYRSRGTYPTAAAAAELDRRSRYWRDLSAGVAVAPAKAAGTGAAAAPTFLDLPLTTQWNQGEPHNAACPVLPIPGAPRHVVVGCVATAMAQVMGYWQWPPSGVGSGTNDYRYRFRTDWDEEPLATAPTVPAWFADRLTWTADGGGRLLMSGYWDSSVYWGARDFDTTPAYQAALDALWARMPQATTTASANFGAATYDWSAMPDSAAVPPGPGELEIAEVGLHAGIAVGMSWGIWSSGAYTSDARDRLVDTFRYDPDAVYQTADQDLMVAEIQWLRPIAFSGHNADGGHAWVIFGYDTSTAPNYQFHMNMGWSDTDLNDWYTLDSVPSGLADLYPRHITGLAPDEGIRFVGGGTSGDGSPADPYRDIDEALLSVPAGTRLVLRAGSTNTFAGGPLVIDQPVVLTGMGATIE